ncbi:MAG: hypothetical protein KC618_06015 [Candidatus Omnitrophica bacterium]|nr:hypothetical protein [Candidatus Omnitrophota bacterium]
MKPFRYKKRSFSTLKASLFIVFFLFITATSVLADITMGIVAVNATDEVKTKKIKEYLPPELALDDVFDTDGLDLDYDINEEAYFVHGEVELQPSETKKFSIRMRDMWKLDQEEIEEIRKQIEESFKRLQGTDHEELAKVKRDILLDRLKFIVEQEAQNAGDVAKRMDQSRAYAKEFEQIRTDSINVKYWRSQPVDTEDKDLFTFVVKVENTVDEERELEPKHFLPSEVRPEHLVDTQGLSIRYDGFKKQLYLTKKEVLQAKEKKEYQISVLDVWNVDPIALENLKERTRKTYKLLEPTEYKESAQYLVASIKGYIENIEVAQQQKAENIKEHISGYRVNKENYDLAKKDVETMENLLEAVRENLERSKVKNVLQKITKLKSVAEISKSVFKKPKPNTAWKIIVTFLFIVLGYTILHFSIWGKKSSKMKEKSENNEEA